jgi:hypothetical protein
MGQFSVGQSSTTYANTSIIITGTQLAHKNNCKVDRIVQEQSDTIAAEI